jgi:threonine synthase
MLATRESEDVNVAVEDAFAGRTVAFKDRLLPRDKS